MNKNLRFLSLIIYITLLSFSSTKVFAQCPGGNNNGVVAFQCDIESIINPLNQGDYRQFAVITNISYNFNTNGTSYDTRLYGNVTGVGGANQFNQDIDNVVGNNESIDWTATFTGTLGVGVHYFACATWNGTSAVLRHKQNTTVTNTTSNATICMGTTKALTAVLGGLHNNPTISWSVIPGTGNGTIAGTTFTPSAPGTVTVRATVGVCSSDVTFTINSLSVAPTSIGISSGNNPTCPGVGLTLTVSGGSLGTGANWVWYSGSCGGGGSLGSGVSISVSPSLATTYFVRAEGTCNTSTCASLLVTVYSPLSASLSGGSTNICYNTAPAQFSATGSGGTGSYTYLWYLNGVSTGVSTQTYTPPALTSSSTVYCAVTSGSCGTVNTSSYTVNVYGNLTASLSGGSTNICYNTAPAQFTATGSGGTGSYTYLWYRNGVSTGITTQTYTSPAFTSSGTVYCAVTSGSCGTVNTSTYTVNVYANLTASLSGGSTNICYNTAPAQFTATGTGGTGSYTYLWYLNGVSTGVTTQTYTAPAITSNASVYCAVTSGSCGTVNTSTYTVTVYANLTAALSGGSTNICYNTVPAQFTATGSGATGLYTYLWYLNGVSTGITTQSYIAPALTATSTVYCAVTSGSCGTVNTSTYTVTVYANLTAALSGGSTNICYNTAPSQFTATGAGATGSYTYLWYLNGVSTGITTQTYTAPALTANANVYCAVNSGSCGPVNTSTYSVNVYGNLTATLSGGSTNICYNSAPAQFTATGTGGTGSYTYLWYLNGVSTGTTTQTYNALALTANATVYCAVTSGSCGTVNTSTYSVTILSQVNYGTLASGNEAACVTTNPANIIFSTAPAGSGSFTYQWYYQDGLISCPSGSSTAGWTSIGGATSSSYDPPAGLTVSRTYAAMVIPGGSPTCGTPTWATQCRQVTINPLPVVSFSGLSGPYCANASNVTLTGSPSGGTFSGTGVSGNTFFPAIALVGNNSVTYTYTDGNGCTNSQTQSVLVNGLPSVSFTGFSGTYCVSQSTPVLLTGNQTGGTFSGTGITNLGSGTANFTPSTAGAGVHNITFTYTDGNGCTNSQTQSVQVIALPLVSFSGLAAAYCVSNSAVQLTGFPSGGTFSGTLAVTSGGLFSPSAGTGNYTITYTYTNGNGCTNSTSQSTVVNALPVVSFSGFNIAHQYCENAAVVNLVGSPGGGTFSGQGVTGTGVFTPSTAGLGTFTVTYSYSDGNGCNNTTTQSVTVVAVPSVSFTGLIGDYCVNAAPVTLTGNQGTNGTFSGPGITNNGNGTASFSPAVAGIGGSYSITFSYTNGNGCTDSETQQTVVHPQPVVAFSGLAAAYCVDANPATLIGSHNPGGSFTGTGITDNGNGTATFDPAAAGVGGLYAITYSYSDGFGCSNSISENTLVNDTPTVFFTGLQDICIDQPALTLIGTPSGGVFSGTGVSGNQFFPSLSGLGVFPVTYTYSDGNGCEGMYADSLRVYDIPQITVQANDAFVCPGDNASFNIAAIGIGLTYQWMVNDGNGFVVVNNVGIYSGATTNTLSITNVPSSINGYQYTCVVTGATCLTSTTSGTVTIIENPSPVINTQPVDYASCAGDNAVFSVNASGTNLTYQWQVNTGGGFLNVSNGGVYSGATTNTLNITGFTVGMDGYQYQCVVTGSNNCTANSITNVATLNATNSPDITTQPVSQSICEGDNAVFTVTATGTGITYQWQEDSGGGFANISNGGVYSGATSAALTVSGVTAGMDGNQYHCIISGSICVGSSTSDVVLITITTSPSISQQPVDAYVCPTDPASFSVTTQGTGITYQWQVNNGSGFINVANGGVYSGATTATLDISSVFPNMDGYEYRCVINGTFCSGTSTSLSGIIHMNGAPVITQGPSDMNYCVGDNATFTVTASGTGLTYQWQVDNGSGWVDLVNGINYSGANTSSLTVVAAPLSFDGNQYQCIVSGSINCSGTTTSSSAVLTEDPNPYISTQPVDQYVCDGDNAVFSVTASGSGLTYQWQENTGGGFVNVTNGGVYSGATTSTLTITGTTSGMDGYIYQCIINGTICSGTSVTTSARLNATTSPFISVQPQDESVCIGDNLAMTVTANGSGLTYQWQVNTGSGFVNVTNGGVYNGANTASLNISGATVGMNAYQYQVIINGTSCPSASTSATANLYVGQGPMIVTDPVNTAICAGFDASFSITSLGNNLTYQWQVNTGSGFNNITNGGVYSNATTTTLNITAAPFSMNSYQYQCVVTGSINCALASTSVAAVLTVNPPPVVSFSGLNSQYCVDAPLVTLTGVPSGGTFIGAGISGNNFSAATAGVGGPYTILYEYTDGNGCYNSTTYAVTVNPLPVVSFSGLAGPYCINDNTPVALTGSPSGGVFSGTGVTGNTFVPSIATLGNNSVTYTYTNLNGCVNFQTQVAVVNPQPVVSFTGLSLAYCEDFSVPVTLTGNNAPGGTFTSNGAGLTDIGNGTASYVASVAGAGTHTITYTYTNGNGCTNSQTQSVLINTLPAVTSSGLASQYCVTNPVATLTGFPAGGTFSGAGIIGNTFNPATAGLGSHVITYSYTNPSTGCSNTTTQTTIVYAMPVANAGTGGNSCGLTFALAASPSVGNGTWTVTGPGTATYSPNASSASATATVSTFGTYTFTWTENNNGCSSAASVTVNFYAQPVVSAGTGGSECDLDFTFNGSTNLGSGTWSSSGPGTAFYTNVNSPTSSVMVSVSGIYTFTFSVTNGTCSASSQVTVNFNTLPVANAGQGGSECDLDFVFNATPSVGTGTWTQLSGPGTSTYSPDANDPAATVTVTAIGTYVYQWEEDHNGCTSSDNVSVVYHALPVVNITGLNATYCINESSVINMTGTPAGGVFSGPGVVGTVFNPAVAGAGIHTVAYDYTDNFGCSNSHSQQVEVYDISTTSFTGLALEYCIDNNTPVALTGIPSGGTYSGAGISGNSFTASDAGVGTHTITYTAANGNGCMNTTTQTVVVNPLPVVSFTGLAAEYCFAASAVTLTGSPSGGNFSGAGITGNSFDPSAASAGTHTITYIYTDGNSCVNSTTQSVVVRPAVVVTTTPSGTTAFCQGGSVLLAASNGFTTYQWSNGNTNQSFLVNLTGQYTVDVTDAFGCTGTSLPVNVNVNALPVVDLGNDTTICTGNNVTLDAGTFVSYSWSPGGATTSSIVAFNNGAYVVTVTDDNGCVNSDQVGVTVAALLQPTVTSSSQTNTFCQGGSLTLDAGPGYASYQWSDGVTLTETINVIQAGYYSVFVTDNSGCTGASTPVSVTMFTVPAPLVFPDGPLEFCPGEDVTLTAGIGYTSYSWSPGGETTSSITVDQAGSYVLSVQDQNSCPGTSDTIDVNVFVVTTPVILSDGPLQFCHGNDVILSVQGNYASYLWTSGSTTPEITVNQSGNYGVIVLDLNGCIDSSLVVSPVTVTVWQPVPFIVESGDSLTCTPAFTSYQWFENDTMVTVAGATSQTLITQSSGNYMVVVTDANGCTGMSDIIEHSQSGIEDHALNAAISIYPNPTNSVFTFNAQFSGYENLRLELTNAIGQLIIPVEDVRDVITVKRDYNLNHLADGMYMLTIRTDKGSVTKRIIKN